MLCPTMVCKEVSAGAFFFCPGLKKQAEAGNPSFPWRKGTSRPLPPSSQKNRPHRGRFFCDCRKTLRVFRPFICFPGFPRAPAPRIPPACPCKCSASPHQQVCHAGKTWWTKWKKCRRGRRYPGANNKIPVANVTELQDSCCKCAAMGLHCRKPVCRRIATKRRP